MNKKIIISRGDFIFGFVVYTLISIMLFVLTSGGWGGLAILIYGTILFLIILIGLIIFVVLKFPKETRVMLPLKTLLITVGLQILALLFNVGDCGDVQGSNYFLQRIFFGSGCGHGLVVSTVFINILLSAYLIFLLFTLFFSSRSIPKNEAPSTYSPVLKIILRIIGVLVIVGIIAFILSS
ncbi:MAG: hypothetical protein NT077_03390 [Candidatus Taylorbacteria bacterium]|nr:hypothetical protein [Candidatus Taylorbacteria bacterium]